MLSQVFQPLLDQMKTISTQDMGVMNNSGSVVAYVGEPILEELAYDVVMNTMHNGKPVTYSDYTFIAFGMRNTTDYVVYVHGTDLNSHKLCQLLSVSLSNLQVHCGDKYDKINYLKNVLLGNVLPEIVMHALCIAIYAMFVAIVVPCAKKEKPLLIVVLCAAALSAVFYYAPYLKALPSGLSISICAVVCAVFGALLFPIKEEGGDER